MYGMEWQQFPAPDEADLQMGEALQEAILKM